MSMKTENGSYMPSYFFIYLDSKEALNAEGLEKSQTFFHEYIHFLQDIILPYNIKLNLVETRNLFLIESFAQKKGIPRPFDNWDEDSKITKMQKAFTWGDTAFINEKEDIYFIREYYEVLPDKKRLFKYSAVLESGKEYQIGARDLLEYIASKIESKHWREDKIPHYPYNTIDDVFAYHGIKDASTECKIAIAEYCLHNDNPMRQFALILNALNQRFSEEIFSSYKQLSEILKATIWNAVGGFSETMVSKSSRRLKHLQSLLGEKFTESGASDLRNWLDKVIKHSAEHMKGRLYFSELYLMSKDEVSEEFRFHIRKIGIPLIINKNKEHFSLLPDNIKLEQFIHLYFYYLLLDFVLSEKKLCSAYDFCRANHEDVIEKFCKDDPLKKWGNDPECPMGDLVKRHSLNKIT